MDIATIIGLLGAFGVILASILMGSPLDAFIDVPSLVVVGGGTMMVTLVMQKLPVVLGAFKVAMNAISDKGTAQKDLIAQITDFAFKAKKGGILVLESEEIADRFLNRGILMAVDGIDVEEIRESLQIDLDGVIRRHKVGQDVFKFMAATSPAMGMIGTLIGLVQMLCNLSDPDAIGPAMAIALLTTFYGAILAFVVFGPIAAKLATRTDREKLAMEVVIAGVEGIAKGVQPRVLQNKLSSYLAPNERSQDDEAEKAA